MIPLRVEAVVAPTGLALPAEPLELDSLLAAVVAQRQGLAPPMSADEVVPIEIPVQMDPGRRFHLASAAQFERAAHELRYVNRRFPVEQAQTHGREIRRVQITAGPAKSYRIPMEIVYPVGGRLTWWCVGDRDAVEDLLGDVLYLGKKRNAGHGRVASWTVSACDTWPGFPVVLDGRPLRPLPPDWPALAGEQRVIASRLTYPYWLLSGTQPCVVP